MKPKHKRHETQNTPMNEEEKEDFEELWKEHLQAGFPSGFGGIDINNICLVLLDSDIAGCVMHYLKHQDLHIWHVAVLGRCYKQADSIVYLLNDQGAAYFWRLSRLAELLLKEIEKKYKPVQ